MSKRAKPFIKAVKTKETVIITAYPVVSGRPTPMDSEIVTRGDKEAIRQATQEVVANCRARFPSLEKYSNGSG